jgi:hypothetical protein
MGGYAQWTNLLAGFAFSAFLSNSQWVFLYPGPFCHSSDRAECAPTSWLKGDAQKYPGNCGDGEEHYKEPADFHGIRPKLVNSY